MAYQAVFRRYEMKYLLTEDQYRSVLEAMVPYMSADKYGLTTIRNIYFDTNDFRLIRRSTEKPLYKEKLRLRSYGAPKPGDPVFVELKKKFDGVVYKRRVSMVTEDALDWICRGIKPGEDPQIVREIDYFKSFYGALSPTVFLGYDRVAYYAADGSDFRVTFDRNIRFRQENIRLDGSSEGQALLPEGMVLMEVKSIGGMPLWMTGTLTKLGVFKTSFSKYGTAYEKYIFPNQEVFANGSAL